MSILTAAWDFLATEQPLGPCDLIFVFAGVMDRKPYGLELLRRGLAPRLVLSVGRSEVRQTAQLTGTPELLALRDQTPPNRRHFWVEVENERARIARAELERLGTFTELKALAGYLAPRPPAKIALVSTSIHLRRVGFCCSRIPFFAERDVMLWAVPEDASSFRREHWWKRGTHWRYVAMEYAKLGAYSLLHR